MTGPRLVDQHLRRGEGTSIAVLDIDHFKRLNDTYGHEIGDLVLKHVARQLKLLVGEEHLLARLGGEEFGILFDSLGVRDAFAFCEKLRAELAKLKIVADDEELGITVSIGLATIEAPESFENYLHAADQFLYMTYEDRLFAALADPTRRGIFERLGERRRSVAELARAVPVSQPAISQHLKVLKEARLVRDEAVGARRIYSIDPAGLGQLRQWLDRFWREQLAAFESAVEAERRE